MYKLIEVLEDFIKDTSKQTLCISKDDAHTILRCLEKQAFMFSTVDLDSECDY